ncbi:hypothetical protein ACLBWS_16535 [Brucellaceae bacterium D45D]
MAAKLHANDQRANPKAPPASMPRRFEGNLPFQTSESTNSPLRDKALSFRWAADYKKLSEVIELPACRSAKAEKALASILYDAALTARTEPERRISYSRTKDFYRAADRYFGADYGYATVVPAVDALVEAGFLTEHDKRPAGSRGIQSSFRPSPELAGLLLPSVTKRSQELIRLKDTQGHLASYRDTERTMRDRKFLEAVNRHISASRIELHAPDGVHDGDLIRFGTHTVYTHMNELYRVFNGGWTFGGRMYGGWWQQVKSGDRQHFVIDGGATCEVDYEMLHPRLLYAAAGERLDGDAYSIQGWDRKVCKRAFNILLNANNYHSAKGAILPYVDGDERAAVALIHDIKRRHGAVADKFHSGAGLKLQYMDSEMAKAVIHELTVKNGITTLPIHDSFIVREEHENDLVDCMERAFLKVTSTVENRRIITNTYVNNDPHMEERRGPGVSRRDAAAVVARSLGGSAGGSDLGHGLAESRACGLESNTGDNVPLDHVSTVTNRNVETMPYTQNDPHMERKRDAYRGWAGSKAVNAVSCKDGAVNFGPSGLEFDMGGNELWAIHGGDDDCDSPIAENSQKYLKDDKGVAGCVCVPEANNHGEKWLACPFTGHSENKIMVPLSGETVKREKRRDFGQRSSMRPDGDIDADFKDLTSVFTRGIRLASAATNEDDDHTRSFWNCLDATPTP